MKLLNKFMLAFLGIIAMSAISAYQDNCEPQPVCPPEPPCCDIPCGPTTSAYNHPASIDVCGSWDFYVTGTFLWWQPRQEQMATGANPVFAFGTSTLQSKGQEFNFDWKPAFKVGVGYSWGYDAWDSYFQYTRVNTSMTNRETLSNEPGALLTEAWGVQPLAGAAFIPVAYTIRELSVNWKLDHNMFDLELGRPYYNGKNLTFKVHYGLRGGWIDQTLTSTATDTVLNIALPAYFKSDSWLIGPRAGFYTNWGLDEGFRLFGNGAFSLFYQKFTKVTHQEPLYINPSLWFMNLNFPTAAINTSLEMLIGLGWGSYFSRNNWHFDLSLGYEAQVYFDQNYMRVVSQSIRTGASIKAGNLMFHGLNVTAKLDF